MSSAVRLKFSPQLGLIDHPDGSLRDAHWFRLDEDHGVHFGFVRSLEQPLKRGVCDSLAAHLGVAPSVSFVEAVDLRPGNAGQQ